MNDSYQILVSGGEAETELKKSRFIAHVFPASTEEEARSYVEAVKKQYYDARHNCYAYVLGKDADRVKYSDDGEPAQTGGLPIYNVLKETKIRNAVIVVTRYFGGTLLGAGPLARMYAEAAKLGLENSKVGTMVFGVEASVLSDYSDGEKIKRYLEKEAATIVDISYLDSVKTVFRTGFEQYEKIERDITSLTASKAKTEKIGEAYSLQEDSN